MLKLLHINRYAFKIYKQIPLQFLNGSLIQYKQDNLSLCHISVPDNQLVFGAVVNIDS